MIPLPGQFEAIEAKLKARLITGSEASQAIFVARRKLGPPWHWKSWRAARKEVLGPACETCGAGEEAILYVQHTIRLPSINRHKERARLATVEKGIELVDYLVLRGKMDAIRDSVEANERDCCPKCESLSIQYRKRAGTWICNSKSTGKYCANVFAVPFKKVALTADQKNFMRVQKHRTWRSTILNRDDDWMRDAILAWISEMRVYLSLKHIKTLCKRCAFLEDMTDLKPCLSCGATYPKSEQVCPECESSSSD